MQEVACFKCIIMESRELSESMSNHENDATLNQELVAQQPTAVNDESKENVEPSQMASEPVAAQPEVPVQAAEPQPEPVAEPAVRYDQLSKDELVAKLKQLAEQPVDTIRDEVAAVKAAFYAIRKDELAHQKEAFVAEGGEPDDFVAGEDDDENTVKQLLATIKDRRAEFNAAQEAERLRNLELKKGIIQQINEIVSDPDNINRQFSKVQQLQQEFKAVGAVPATDETDIWKAYQQAVEKFYDLLKINKELRDYDFKKNLEIKQQLCLEAEQLDEQPDIVTAFRKLQDLHSTWRETGPVAKELREDIWARFKNASALINKKYQAYFEERKAREKEIMASKTELCERVEAIDLDALKTNSAWEEATKQVIEWQQQWREIGYFSRRASGNLFARFRKACDNFFARKTEYYKSRRDTLAANLALKNELCERAEALMDSTDWRAASEQFVAMQKEWKTIGPVARKHSDAVWQRFIAACDHFFEQRKKQSSGVHATEHANLKAKKEIIATLKAMLEAEQAPDDAAKQVRDLIAQWQGIGHVPYKEKDKIYNEYRQLVDKAFEQFDIKGSRAHLANFESNLGKMEGSDRVYHERERLVRAYEQKCNELKTYENNMGFFNAQSKTGNSIVKEMERKIERLKEDIAMLETKIKMVDDKM